MTELIITEKPSSAQKVAEALADTKPIKKKNKQSSYYELTHNKKPIIVTSAVGHLYGLIEDKKKGWTYPVFEIRWTSSDTMSKGLKYVKDYVDTISMLAKKAQEFTVACDYDIEGEVIGLNVMRFACKQKDANRMKFSTLTKPDLVAAYEKKMHHLDWGQAYAGETRHKLDWFYGINLSRALTSSVKAAGSFKIMSAGRVQGPTLKLLVDREREIQAFKPTPFWQIQLTGDYKRQQIEAWHERKINIEEIKELTGKILQEFEKYKIDLNEDLMRLIKNTEDAIKKAKVFLAWEDYFLKNLKENENKGFLNLLQNLKKALDTNKFWEKTQADKIIEKTKNQKDAKVDKIEKNEFKQMPPFPFDLTSLQIEAYRCFNISPKETLAIAQTLYLAGVTSYPRTSSQQLDPKIGFAKILKDLQKQPAYGKMCDSLLHLKELKPNNGKKTDPAHPAIYPTGLHPTTLKPREQKVYDLIVKRFLATFAKPAVRETMEVLLDVKGEMFFVKGTRTIEANWHIYYQPYLKLEEITLPDMKEGEIVNINKIAKVDKETQPPKRFNQASIIKELERRNLGTKATRADILDRLFQRGYIEGVQITATKLGIETTRILEKYAPLIVDENLTAHFEEDMEKIREEKEKPEKVLEEAKRFLIGLLADFKKKEKEIGEDILQSVQETRDIQNYIGTCHACKEGKLVIKSGKFGKFIACDKYPDCKATFKLPGSGLIKNSEKICEHCQYPMVLVIRKGKQPQDICINQDCKSKTSEEEKKEIKKFEHRKVEKKCPKCGKDLVLRKSMYGSFIGCSGYPNCKHIEKLDKGEK